MFTNKIRSAVFVCAMLSAGAFASDVVNEAIKLSAKGVSDEIIQAWAERQHDFEVTVANILALRSANVPDKAIVALIKAGGASDLADGQSAIQPANAQQQVVAAGRIERASDAGAVYGTAPAPAVSYAPSTAYATSTAYVAPGYDYSDYYSYPDYYYSSSYCYPGLYLGLYGGCYDYNYCYGNGCWGHGWRYGHFNDGWRGGRFGSGFGAGTGFGGHLGGSGFHGGSGNHFSSGGFGGSSSFHSSGGFHSGGGSSFGGGFHSSGGFHGGGGGRR